MALTEMSRAVAQARNSFCARHRPAYGIVLVACGLMVALASFAWWVDQGPSAPVIGVSSLISTSIFALNNFIISRVCVTHNGIQRVEWLGLINRHYAFQSLLGIDIGQVAGLLVPHRALEIRLRTGRILLTDKEYSHETLRALITSIQTNYPQAPVTESARRYVTAAYTERA